ncbi:MAG: hypothetical protein A2Y60_01815 [Chloroflexi bacterium RBG_13_54_9]|nr:MAG: hypothetical protein A2Y60_01815 [Chloroflexi bacterium RBG_13_54_9]
MSLENRIKNLEQHTVGATANRETLLTDDILHKLGLDPDKVRTLAKEKNQSRMEVTAGELGMPYADFVRELTLRVQGK